MMLRLVCSGACGHTNLTMVDAREETLRVRMSGHERTMLVALAEGEQLTQSDYIRHLVRREFAALKPKRKKARRG